MSYADYTYYLDTYGGLSISSEADFAALAREASLFIDMLTFRKLVGSSDIPESVSMATCAVAEKMQMVNNSGALSVNPAYKSENNDGYSVTYNLPTNIRAQVYSEYKAVALPYLYGTGLLYAGVSI